MGSKNDMTRKEFITLTFTLIGAGTVGACSSDNNSTGTGGTYGGTAGTFGTTGGGGSGGHAGSAGHGGSGGTTGAGGTGGTGAAACADPLPETQVADTTGHSHMVIIHPSVLSMTTAQTFTTTTALTGAEAHTHTVTLEPAQLAALKSGGTVTVMSSINMSHGHGYAITCT